MFITTDVFGDKIYFHILKDEEEVLHIFDEIKNFEIFTKVVPCLEKEGKIKRVVSQKDFFIEKTSEQFGKKLAW